MPGGEARDLEITDIAGVTLMLDGNHDEFKSDAESLALFVPGSAVNLEAGASGKGKLKDGLYTVTFKDQDKDSDKSKKSQKSGKQKNAVAVMQMLDTNDDVPATARTGSCTVNVNVQY